MANTRAHSFSFASFPACWLAALCISCSIPGATTSPSSLRSPLRAQPQLNKVHLRAFVTMPGCRDWYWSNCSLYVNVWGTTSVLFNKPHRAAPNGKHRANSYSKALMKGSPSIGGPSCLSLPSYIIKLSYFYVLCADSICIFSLLAEYYGKAVLDWAIRFKP